LQQPSHKHFIVLFIYLFASGEATFEFESIFSNEYKLQLKFVGRQIKYLFKAETVVHFKTDSWHFFKIIELINNCFLEHK